MFSPEERKFIESRRVAHLATANGDGRPHLIPVCFVYVDGAFWIPVDEKPKKTPRLKRLRNIEANPQVALMFDRYEEDWSRLAYVLVHGTGEIRETDDRLNAVLAALREKYAQYGRMKLEGRPIIKVAPERAVGWGSLG